MYLVRVSSSTRARKTTAAISKPQESWQVPFNSNDYLQNTYKSLTILSKSTATWLRNVTQCLATAYRLKLYEPALGSAAVRLLLALICSACDEPALAADYPTAVETPSGYCGLGQTWGSASNQGHTKVGSEGWHVCMNSSFSYLYLTRPIV